MVGHVDHGKTTLVNALSGEWTDRHSEEIKRGISIRLGYADATFRRCPKCKEPDCYTVENVCKHCGSKTEELRTVSFVDSPGHEALMATMLSGAAIMDGAVLLIAASEPCPQPQTKEHLMALSIVGIKNLVIAQNKVDLVTREDAFKHYLQIKEFIKGTIAEDAPIVPISAQQSVNIDVLIQKIEETIPTPDRPEDVAPLMYIARSFDVNKPGTPIENLKGGVIGGSLLRGKLRVGDRLEIRPGRMVTTGSGKPKWVPIETEITSIMAGGVPVEEVTPGGLIGVGTKLDPSMTIEDSLVGQCVGLQGSLPPTRYELTVQFRLLERVVGVAKEMETAAIKVGESLMLSVGTAITMGEVKKLTKNSLKANLIRPVCADTGARVAIARKIGARWHLIGAGTVVE